LRSLTCLDEPALREEINTALHTTEAHGLGHGHILCDCDLGNLELRLETARTFPNTTWATGVDRRAASSLNSIERDRWRRANPMSLDSLGLMTGLAGIGYGLLRLADPARVPSVLTPATPPDSVHVQNAGHPCLDCRAHVQRINHGWANSLRQKRPKMDCRAAHR